ncbi:MAG TPA: hypothetical protein VFV95_02860 [Vicinamibacterales bacterium]|nr:hypothetical protein [Vicinamibacterales bacterium]
MTLHLGSNPPKFLLQLGGLGCPEFIRNCVAQPVLVDPVKLRPKQHLLLLQPQHRCPDELLLVGLALPEHCRQLAGEFSRDSNVLEDLAELADELFFTNVRVAARSLVARAVVVHVLALLGLCRERATAPTARDQSGERVPPLRVLRMIGCRKYVLDAGEQVARDDRLVKALM